MRTLHRLALLAASCAALGAGAPAVAQASTLTVENGAYVLRAAPNEANTIRLDGDDANGRLEVHDAALTNQTGGACEKEQFDSEGTVTCTQALPFRAELGDRVDTFDAAGDTPIVPTHVDGGDGNDDLEGSTTVQEGMADTFIGGPGDDTLRGYAGNDVLDGGPGTDKLRGSSGDDQVRGGEGGDEVSGDDLGEQGADLIDGGPGLDQVDLEWQVQCCTPQPPITVTLDDGPGDGRPGEGDDVRSIEDVYSTAGLAFRAGGEALTLKTFNTGPAGSAIVGSPQNDTINVFDHADAVDGAAGDDTLIGGFGNDTITGGPGRDTINADAPADACTFLQCRAGAGNDTVQARDGEADTIDCGPGTDTAVVDAADVVTGCETVDEPKTDEPDPPKDECKTPKVKKGSTLKAAKAKVKRAGCSVKVKKVKAKGVKKGRVVRVRRKGTVVTISIRR